VGRVATRYVFICEQVDDPIILVLQINQALKMSRRWRPALQRAVGAIATRKKTSLARGRCGCATRGSASLRCARVLAKVRPETRRACRLVCCRWNFRLNVLAANWEDSCPCPVKSAGLKSLASNQTKSWRSCGNGRCIVSPVQ
jgi:hypothetical protein